VTKRSMRRVLTSTALLLMLALAGGVAQAAITQDTVSTAGSSTSTPTSLSWTHTVNAGSNVYLVVALSFRVDNNGSGAGAGTYASGITANGTGMNCAVAITDNDTGSCQTAGATGGPGGSGEPYVRSEMWYLSLGTISTQTSESIVATLSVANSQNGSAIAATSISYFGVSAVSSGADAFSNNGVSTSTSASLAVTASATQLVVSNISLPKSSTSVASSPNTRLSDVSGTATFDGTQDATSSASGSNPTMGWTWSGAAPYSLTAVVLTPASTSIKRKGQTIVGSLRPPKEDWSRGESSGEAGE